MRRRALLALWAAALGGCDGAEETGAAACDRMRGDWYAPGRHVVVERDGAGFVLRDDRHGVFKAACSGGRLETQQRWPGPAVYFPNSRTLVFAAAEFRRQEPPPPAAASTD